MSKFVLALCLLCLISCNFDEPSLQKRQYFIFGTVVELLVWHKDKVLVEQASLVIEKQLNVMHKHWHAWKPGRLQDINKGLRTGHSLRLTKTESAFIHKVITLSEQSLGYFDPTIGELIHLWGFHSDDYPIIEPPPTDQQISVFLDNAPSIADLKLDNNLLSSSNLHLWLDFGGIAKGYAVDQIIETLRSFGINHGIVNAGGDLRSIGGKNDQPWKVAIRKPNSDDVLAVIEVDGDESIFTSGNYARYKTFKGKRYAHIIDPKTGYGVNEIVSATVIAELGIMADAAATAMIVAGPSKWFEVAQSMQVSQVLLLDVNGKCYATKKMMVRLKSSDLQCFTTNE